MWTSTYTKFFPNISKESIWKVWSDVDSWPAWHGDLDYCKLEGDFAVGSFFMLKPKGAPAVKVRLLEMDPYESFLDCTHFFGAKMYDKHELREEGNGLWLTNTLTINGPLNYLWRKLVAENVAATISEEMEALVKAAKACEQTAS